MIIEYICSEDVTGKIAAKVRKVDDELLYRQTEITYGEMTIKGPTRAIGYGLKQEKTVAEGYSEFDKGRIERVTSDNDFQSKVEGDMKKKYVDGALNLHFVSYTQPTSLSEKEITALTNLEYVCSEVAITPCWSGLLKDKVDDERVKTLNAWNLMAIEAIERKNNKSIMGVIPAKVHHTMIDSVIKTFVDQNVTHFAIDHMGRSLKNREAWLRELYIQLESYKLMDNSLLYSINAPAGRLGQKKEKVLADDFMSSAYGIDVLGFNHTRGRDPKPKPPISGLNNVPQPAELSYRQFDSDSYAYVKIAEGRVRAALNVPVSKLRDEIKRRNTVAQLAEYNKLGGLLAEEPTTLKYVSTKEMVNDDVIASIKKVRTERKVRQKKLFN